MSAAEERAIRNVAIIAHVDHGKTTLVDKLILQTGILRDNQELPECALDSNDLERERGITILSKNISVSFKGVKINLIDTPGHADFGGEVERVVKMADGCLLLVDAFEGPMPQTRFVLRKALEAGLKPVLVVNKMDRAPDRGEAAVDAVFDLMVELGATDDQLDFPVLFAAGRDGWARRNLEDTNTDLLPLLETIIERVPPPPDSVEGGTQMQVTTLDWSAYTGRMAIGRVSRGRLRAGSELVILGENGSQTRVRPRKLLTFVGMARVPVQEVEAGDLCALEGLDVVNIGDTVCDPDHLEALPRGKVEEPTVAMIFQINDGPFAGKEGKFVTSRQIRDRLYRETEKNVALRVEDTGRPEALKVSGRGILHLGILIEEMRREGYEFCVGKPIVITKEIDGVRHEPVETVIVEAPDGMAGRCIELIGSRRGQMIKMENEGDLVRLEYRCPSRGLFGLRTPLLNLTQGEATLHHVFAGYEPESGEIPGRANGVMISSETGSAIHFALGSLKDRGSFFIESGTPVYEGMVVGEHCKSNDIEVNVCKAKKLTNIRASGSDKKTFLPPAHILGVEEALEYLQEDEMVEITPQSVRVRKLLLRSGERRREKRRLVGS